MVFSLFMPMLDHLVLNVSLPTIQRAIFTVASALSGFSETTSQLIATRGLQGRMRS
jgi:hypothetical protein